jgi:hypothetical protein
MAASREIQDRGGKPSTDGGCLRRDSAHAFDTRASLYGMVCFLMYRESPKNRAASRPSASRLQRPP